MRKILLWIWQLPQNLLGYFLIKILKAHTEIIGNDRIYYAPMFDAGVSLGSYIILDEAWKYVSEHSLLITIFHEQGHQKQSKILGPLYLVVVGIPSVLGNIWARIKHKNSDWYYSRYPENWADKLGGVKRK